MCIDWNKEMFTLGLCYPIQIKMSLIPCHGSLIPEGGPVLIKCLLS